MRLRLLVGLLILGACTDLPAYEADTCGNFTLELGEDCDEDSDSCFECKLRCDAGIGVLPEEFSTGCSAVGYVCGVDGFCHAPSGVFESFGRFSQVRARDLVITNVDFDGIGDVLGLGTNAISVHRGDPTGNLLPTGSILSPQVRGFPAFVDLDNTNSLDLLVPTADGIAAYSSPNGYVAPHSFAFDLTFMPGCQHSLLENQPFEVFSLSDRYIGVLTFSKSTNYLGLAVVDTTQKTVCPTQLPLVCTDLPAGNPRFMPPDLDVYETATPGKVIAVRTAGGMCVVHARESVIPNAPPFDFTDITPSRGLTGRPVLADISGTGCPSLIVMAPMREYLGINVAGDCTLATSSTPIPIVPGAAIAIGHLELQPRVASHGKDALVMSSGVFALSQSRLTAMKLYQSDRPLTFVQSGDIDRDGDLDGVAIAATMAAGVEDIDVLARTTTGGFLLRRIDTDEPISNFVVGDYDGDEVSDIAFTEQLGPSNERLSVVFGTRDLPLPPVVFGSYSLVVGLCPMQVEDSLDRQNVITDLLVLDIIEGEQGGPEQIATPAFTLLHGSPQRTLQSFIDPRTTADSQAPTVFGGVAAGNFFGNTSVDVMAFEFKPDTTARVWPMSGNKDGQLESVLPNGYDTDIVDCNLAKPGRFCGDSAHYIAWPIQELDAMGEIVEREVVIGIDDGGKLPAGPPRRVVVIDPKKIGTGMNFPGQQYGTENPLTRTPDAVDAAFRVQSLVRVDLEGNGNSLLAVSFLGGEPGDPVTGDVRLCEVDDRGALESCPSITAQIPELAGLRCVDIAAGPLGARGRNLPIPAGTDLAVLCHDSPENGSQTGVFRVWFDTTLNRRKAALLIQQGESPATRILVGDVTGDLLDDLAILLPALGNTFLAIFPQCQASDLACIYPQCGPGDLDCIRGFPSVNPGVSEGLK